MANLHCECQELKLKAEINSSFLVLHPSSGVHTVKTVGSHLKPVSGLRIQRIAFYFIKSVFYSLLPISFRRGLLKQKITNTELLVLRCTTSDRLKSNFEDSIREICREISVYLASHTSCRFHYVTFPLSFSLILF